MNKGRRIRRSRGGNTFLQFFVMTIVCAVVSGGIAYGWQSIQEKTSEGKEKPFSPSTQSSTEQNSNQEDLSSSSDQSSQQSASEETSSSEESSKETSQPDKSKTLVEETERVRSNYFDDAVFIGDSITTGISLYDILPNTTVLASTGINLQSIMTSEVIPSGENKITVLDALSAANANKIYIMLGANGLAFLGAEETVKYYSAFVDAVIKAKPDSIIYIQSIFPIQEEKFAQRYQGNLTNKTIDETNELLLKLAEEKKVYYVEPAKVFKDENGGLMNDVTPDGLHFNAEYYTKWIDYLKVHALTQKD
ncbi:MAG: GDSL-type esterase/lipase family protein [Oscillospiraceae bacterium]